VAPGDRQQAEGAKSPVALDPRGNVTRVDGAVLPLWLSAIAAVLTLAFAATLAALAYRGQRALVRRLDLVEDLSRREAEQRARSQAQLVTAWAVSERETYESLLRRGIVGAAVRNASESPVYDVELIYNDPPAAWTAVRHVGMVPPAGAADVHAGFDVEHTHGVPDASRINSDGSIRLAPSAEMVVEVRFTDARGVRWSRDASGVLAELPTGTPLLHTPAAETEPAELSTP
jgi:hypothetical protein